MKKLAGNGFAILFSIYFMGFMLSAPVFNWRYANRHGFVSWIFFGEIVATAQSAVWPYYLVHSWTTAKDPLIARNEMHYGNAKHACDEALRSIESSGGIDSITADKHPQIIELLEMASKEAKQVSDEYLKSIHADLPKLYQQEYAGSITLLAEGLKSGNTIQQTMAAIKYNNFSEWMSEHSKELAFPK